MGDDLARLLDFAIAPGGGAGECSPPCDVVERDGRIEVIVDLPGVPIESVRIVLTRNTLVIAGQKMPAACEHRAAAFHLAERRFGRFARAVRLTGAIDGSRADATLVAGELRVTLPRIPERRGGDVPISVRSH